MPISLNRITPAEFILNIHHIILYIKALIKSKINSNIKNIQK